MTDLRIVDAPVLLQESITDDVKMPTGGLGNFSVRLGDILWYVITKEQLANKNYVDLSSKGVKDSLDEHIADKANPHQVTKAQVGLGNVDNTADIDKPVSNAVSSAIITATNDMATKAYVNQKDNLKADKATTLSGYGITDAYTKDDTYNRTEIDDALSLKASVAYVDGKDGDLTTLTTNDKTNLVKAINEVFDNTKGVVDLYNKNVEFGVTNGWTDKLIKLTSGRTQHDKNQDFITTRDFGCVGDGVTDDSQNLAKAIKFAYENKRPLDGLGLTYACHSVKFDSRLTFKNANLVCNKFDTDMVSVLDSGAQDVWLEDVYFDNIKINGKRELHTGINQSAITGEDGGRHGFRLGRKMRNMRFVNCEANNCATDGIMLHPWTGTGNNRIVDVQLIDCKFNNNRRHGGSSDSSNNLKLIRVQANNNGGDIDVNADINSGLRGQLFNGKLYGNGWDAEDYDFNDISTNILFEDCEMVGNVRQGLLVYTPGNKDINADKAVITIRGGTYDKGIANDTNESIIITTTLGSDIVKTFENLVIDGVNLLGGDITYRNANANVVNCSKVGHINSLENSITYTDLLKDKVYLASTAKVYFDLKNQNGDITYSNGTLTIAPSTKIVNQYYDVAGYNAGYVDIGIVSGSKLGGLKLKLGSESGQTEVSFTDFNHTPYLTVSNKKITPLRGNYTLGDATYRFENIYLNVAANVASDERIKKDIRTLNDAEKLVAKDLKAEICIYRLKANDDKLQIGVIAQKVVSVFDKHGLNALDYQVVHYDADIDRYSIVYEHLILFILFSL